MKSIGSVETMYRYRILSSTSASRTKAALLTTGDFADYLKARRAKRAAKWKPTDPDGTQINDLPVNFTQ